MISCRQNNEIVSKNPALQDMKIDKSISWYLRFLKN